MSNLLFCILSLNPCTYIDQQVNVDRFVHSYYKKNTSCSVYAVVNMTGNYTDDILSQVLDLEEEIQGNIRAILPPKVLSCISLMKEIINVFYMLRFYIYKPPSLFLRINQLSNSDMLRNKGVWIITRRPNMPNNRKPNTD